MAGMWSIASASTVIGAIVFPIEIFIAELITLNTIQKVKIFTANEQNEPSESLSEAEATLKCLEDIFSLPMDDFSRKHKLSKLLNGIKESENITDLPYII